MACGKTCNVYVCIFRIINEKIFEILSYLDHVIVYELEVDVIQFIVQKYFVKLRDFRNVFSL